MRRLRRTGGLQRKFFIALLIVGIVPGMVALWATYRSSTATLKQAIGEGFQEIARSTSIRLATAVDNEIDRAIRLALVPLHVRQPVVLANEQTGATAGKTQPPPSPAHPKSNGLPAVDQNTASYLDEWARESRHYVRVSIADRQGQVVASTDPRLPPQQAGEVWWREAIQAAPGTSYVSNVTFDPQVNDMVFHVAVPILDDTRQATIGVVDLVIRRNLLTQMILPIHIGNTGHAMLLDTQGTPWRHREAKSFFEGAIDVQPRQVNAYYGLALAAEGLGDLETARGAMRTYVHLAPADDPHRGRAEAAIREWSQPRGGTAIAAKAEATRKPGP